MQHLHISYMGQPVLDLPVTGEQAAKITAAIATENGLRINFTPEQAVPDYERYRFVPGEGLVPLTPREGIPARGTFDASILLILESPHVDEISRELIPRWPAAGASGRQVNSHAAGFGRFLGGLVSEPLPVILCNPVQHPASLRLEPIQADLRDTVFRALAAVPAIAADFQARLERYQPRVIINACTGAKPGSPKALVRAMIDRFLGGRPVHRLIWSTGRVDGVNGLKLKEERRAPGAEVKIVELPHPAAWVYINRQGWPGA